MKRTRNSSTGKYIHRLEYIHTTQYDLAIQRSEHGICTNTNLECVIQFIWSTKNRQSMEIKAHTSGMRGRAIWGTAQWNLLGWQKGSVSTIGCELVTWGHAFDKTIELSTKDQRISAFYSAEVTSRERTTSIIVCLCD